MWQHLKTLDERLFRFLQLETVWRLLAKNRYLVFYLLGLAIVAYGYDLFSFSLKIDSENHAFTSGAKVQWLMQGRWGMYYLNAWLLPDVIMPFIPVLMSILGLILGVLFFLLTLSDQRGMPDFLAAPLVIACPVLAFAFYFTTLGYGLGVAIALSGIGIYALTRWCWQGIVLAIVCFAVGIGIYQAIILLLPVFMGFYLVMQVIASPGLSLNWLLTRCAIFLAVLVSAYGLFETVKFYTLQAYALKYDQEYLQQYINFNTDKDYLSAVVTTLHVAMDYYTGSENYYLFPLKVLAIISGIALFLAVFHVLTARQTWAVRCFAVMVLTGSVLVPMSLQFLGVGDIPPRTMLAIPFVLAGLVFAAASGTSKMLKVLLGVLVVSSFFQFAVINNRFALSNQLNWKADQDLSLLILQRIQQIWQKLPDHPPPYPVEIVGGLSQVETPLYIHRDVVGASFYYWDGGSAERVTRLWASMRQFDFRQAFPDEQLSVAERALAMPVWPAAGSVDVVNGVVVVKLAEYPTYKLDRLCGSAGQLCRFRQPH